MARAEGFADWQPLYAARGIPTFPVRADNGNKRPAVKGYLQVGPRRSRVLAEKFPNAPALGLACGEPSKITVLDVDTPDERILADALDRHGHTPFVVRSGRQHFQAWYRHNGERRRAGKARLWADKPIDVLGAGYVVAPPSRVGTGTYEIIEGRLDDLDRLPVARGLEIASTPRTAENGAPVGMRNDALWRHAMQHAPHCDSFDDVLDVARTFNTAQCARPLDDAEVIRTAQSAWDYTVAGQNRIGRPGAFLSVAAVNSMVGDVYRMALITWLRAHEMPNAKFMVADGLAAVLGWPREQFQGARRRARAAGDIVPLNRPRPGKPIMYRWGGVLIPAEVS